MVINLDSVKGQAVTLCEEVGNFIRAEAARFDRSAIEQKGSFSNLVSYVDKESEERLVRALSEILPGSGYIGEEGSQSNSTNGYSWIIDPLDGTTNFIHGFPMFSISIGLTFHGALKLGVVYDVTHRECFHASEGSRAYCNNTPIQVSTVKTLSESLIATGFPYSHIDKMGKHLNTIQIILEKSHGIRRLGSAALDLAYVACGRLEGFFEYGLRPWDVAGGAFILQQAGGKVTDFQGGDNFLFGDELCAANGIHGEILSIIQSKWK